jgi:transcriptional regulator with PAS, ATPase and Fis domain
MDLLSIKDNVQKTAEAIASVVGVDVTVTDDSLVRIAGTGKYKLSIGEKLNKSGIFAHCLKNNIPYVVRNPNEDKVCKLCGNTDCLEFAEIASPISISNKVYGVIGLIAFNENQKNLLLNNEDNIMNFLDKMASLIAFQIIEKRRIIGNNIITEFNNIKYRSNEMDSVISLAKKASKTDSTVLITGESGTGKELFARALHYDSNRKNEAFLAINCSAIPENLFESELFGYEEGAFTGALKGGHPGKFELAHKGTLLLDEIGDMPLNLQPKLLRVLQDSKVMRIGGKSYIDVDVRIIASTNCNLEEKVKNREFREDLYYRLNVIPINVPPLRERTEDIELLADYFVRKFSLKLNKHVDNISIDALDIIKSYQWHGNVRELENAIEYAVNMTDKIHIDIDSLPNKLKNLKNRINDNNLKRSNSEKLYAEEDNSLHTIAELERNELKKAIKLYGITNNSVNKICEELGISRATFYRKIKKYNLVSKEIIINE